MTSRASAQDDPAKQALDEALELAFRILKGAMLLLILLFLGSGFFQLASHEVGFVRHLGRLESETLQPGLHWCWPALDQVVRIDKRTQSLSLESFEEARLDVLPGRAPPPPPGLNPGREGYLLTGDTHLLQVSLSLRTSPQAPYQRAHTRLLDPEAVLKVLLERSATQAAACRRVEGLLGGEKSSFRQEVAKTLQDSLDTLAFADGEVGAGVEVIGLDLERDLRAPRQVKADFQAVTRATQEVDTLRAEARSEASQIRNAALVEASVILSQAKSEGQRLLSAAEAEAKRCAALLPEYREHPELLKQRLLASTLADCLGKVGEVFLVGEGPLRLRLERDMQKTKAELRERARKEAGLEPR